MWVSPELLGVDDFVLVLFLDSGWLGPLGLRLQMVFEDVSYKIDIDG